MKLKSFFWSVLCMLMVTVAFTACDGKEEIPGWDDNGTAVELPYKRVFILNQGKQNANNGNISFYAPNKDGVRNFVPDLYKVQNQKGLGDTAQDLIQYKNKLYAVIAGSKLLLRLNSAGVEEARLTFSGQDGTPRYVIEVGGKLYVSLWSGRVARIDPETLKIEAYATVNANPEELVAVGNKLYVANSGYGKGNTVSVIDLTSFAKEKDITVVTNPNNLLTVNNNIYLLSWGKWTNVLGEGYTFQHIQADGSVKQIAVASKFAAYGDVIYLIYSSWSAGLDRHIFSTYNTKTGKLTEGSFLKNAPESLLVSTIYGFGIDPQTGEFYLSTSDYKNIGDVYRFKADGTFLEKFECGGLNPSKFVFLP